MPKVLKGKKFRKHNVNQPTKGRRWFNKSFGQHILWNSSVIQNIVNKSCLKPTDIVFEVGPGTGNLTMKIFEQVQKVIACEIDPRLGNELLKRVQSKQISDKLKLVVGDVTKLVKLPNFNVCVSNVPYKISSCLVEKLLAHRPMFRCATLMFQKEFADRLVAKPGSKSYGRLTVKTRLLSRCEVIIQPKKGDFTPPPKVDSVVIRLEQINPPPNINLVELDGLLRIAFSSRNKTLAGNFKSRDHVELLEMNYRKHCSLNKKIIPKDFDVKKFIIDLLESKNFADKRGMHLDEDDFLTLLHLFNLNGIHFS